MQNMAWEAAEGSAGTADWQVTGVDTELGDLASEVARLREQVQQLSEEVESSTPSDQSLPTVRATGQLQSDFMFFGQDAANMAAVGDIQDGAVFRRARFGFLGRYGAAEYQVDMDFALPGRPSFLDVYAGLNMPTMGRVRVGHFFEPFSLERNTSNRFMTLLERSLLDEAFAPARNLGILLNRANAAETLTWAVGGFRTDSDNYGNSVGDDGGRSLTTRVTWLPWYDSANDGRTLVHLGGAYSYRDPHNAQTQFRTRPEARLGSATPNVPPFVDTGIISADHWQLFGLEAAWVAGPFSLQAEQIFAGVSQPSGDRGLRGWYVTTSYFLTGEHRRYRRDLGVFDRVRPATEVLAACDGEGAPRGPGAWEVAFRVSHVDLDDSPIQGGRLTDLTCGVNWYLNPYLRVQTNYICALLDGPTGRSSANIFGARVGFDF